MSLARDVTSALEARQIPYAVIGAMAMAIRGAGRATADFDLLVLDRAALDSKVWERCPGEIDVRRGDADDPLAGVVRIRRDEDSVDVVVFRGARWLSDVLDRAEAVAFEGGRVRVVTVPDLVLLKLDAGGAMDRWDVASLLRSLDSDGTIRRAVESRIGELPKGARELWNEIARG